MQLTDTTWRIPAQWDTTLVDSATNSTIECIISGFILEKYSNSVEFKKIRIIKENNKFKLLFYSAANSPAASPKVSLQRGSSSLTINFTSEPAGDQVDVFNKWLTLSGSDFAVVVISGSGKSASLLKSSNSPHTLLVKNSINRYNTAIRCVQPCNIKYNNITIPVEVDSANGVYSKEVILNTANMFLEENIILEKFND